MARVYVVQYSQLEGVSSVHADMASAQATAQSLRDNWQSKSNEPPVWVAHDGEYGHVWWANDSNMREWVEIQPIGLCGRDLIKDTAFEFLRKLEEVIPPPTGCHHSFTIGKFSEEEPQRLAVNIMVQTDDDVRSCHTLWLDDGDFDDLDFSVRAIKTGVSMQRGTNASND